MATTSDRALFLEMAKTRAMTIKEIHETFGVAAGTARSWTKHELIEEVEGSWPPAFRRKNTFAEAEMPSKNSPTKTDPSMLILEIARPPKKKVEELYDKLMYGELDPFDITRKFMSADSPNKLMTLRNNLITYILLIEYAHNLQMDEEQED